MKSKTIIISSINKNNNGGRGILTFYQEDDLLKCKLRLYNTPKLNPYCKLGVYHNNEVFTANLLDKNGQYESSFVGEFNMDSDFYSAIIDTANNNQVVLAGGTYAGYYFNDTSVFEEKEEEINTQLEEQEVTEINAVSKENECLEDCDKCAHCKYKEFFYAEQNNNEITAENEKLTNPTTIETTEELPQQEETKKETTTNKTPTIIESIIPQFKYVFENYPPDEDLNTRLENAKFVKITENHEQYSIGAIYEKEEMKYICYAIKCNYNTPAPEELGDHYQWLPLDREDPLSEGYYLVFQDAHDLKILEM